MKQVKLEAKESDVVSASNGDRFLWSQLHKFTDPSVVDTDRHMGYWSCTLALSCLIVFIIALNKTTRAVSGATSEEETL